MLISLRRPYAQLMQNRLLVKDGQLLFTRKLVQRASTIPVEQYASVRNFFEKIRAAEQSPVVLAKR